MLHVCICLGDISVMVQTSATKFPVAAVRERANCQLDRVQSFLGAGFLATLVGNYLDYLTQWEGAQWGQLHSLPRILDCVREKGS